LLVVKFVVCENPPFKFGGFLIYYSENWATPKNLFSPQRDKGAKILKFYNAD